MNPTIWLVLFIIFLSAECVTMNLWAASFAPGALVAAIMCFAGLPAWASVAVFVIISGLLFVFVRPILAREMSRHKKQARLDKLIGRTAVVICEINNAHGVGIVNVGGREFRARSKRPNAVISEGSVVEIITMNKDVAIVDDKKRTSTGRLPSVGRFDRGFDFDDDYLD